jgi:hypothetical protein
MHLSNWQATTTYKHVLLSLNNRNDGYIPTYLKHLSYITSCLRLHLSKWGASATSADKLIFISTLLLA